MLKLRLISAALLASLMVPTVASALPSEEVKMVLQARKENLDRRAELRQKLAAGQGNADYLRDRIATLSAKIAYQNARIEKLREQDASA